MLQAVAMILTWRRTHRLLYRLDGHFNSPLANSDCRDLAPGRVDLQAESIQLFLGHAHAAAVLASGIICVGLEQRRRLAQPAAIYHNTDRTDAQPLIAKARPYPGFEQLSPGGIVLPKVRP